MNKNMRDYVERVRKTCEKHNVKFVIRNSKLVDSGDGCKCAGYFGDDTDGSQAELVVAGKDRKWFETLLHESQHMQQWIDNDPVWVNEHDDFWEWVNGNVPLLSKKDIQMSIRRLRGFELDCEKRSVRMIKKYNLPIDIPKYIKAANCYVKFYTLLGKTGAWFTSSPYKHSAIMQSMPDHFMPKAWYRQLDKAFVTKVFRYCYSVNKQKKALAQLLAA